jgi:U3 small nucleolar ribonucleoprotein protein IMP4
MLLPNAQKLNRGGHVVRELVESCRANEATDLVVVHEHRGEPDGLVVCHLPYGPTAHFGLYNVVLRHDVAGADKVAAISGAYPHLIFDNFTTPLGERVMTVLKHLFPVAKEDSQRVVTFANRDDYISFRHHAYARKRVEDLVMDVEDADDDGQPAATAVRPGSNKRQLELTELGPRFELRPFQIMLGTLENDAAEAEWTLHPFTNTAKKKRHL